MADLTDLADFLLARIAEDEAVLNEAAARCSPTPGTELGTFLGDWGDDERWIVDYPLGRALAECEAKRQMVDLYQYAYDDHTYLHCLRLLAAPYVNHSDFRPEWRALADRL